MTTQEARPLGYALIGAGGFGLFCLEQYARMPSLNVRCIADTNADAAGRAAHTYGVDAAHSVEEVLARDDIDIIHVATPPFSHAAITQQVLAAGKHVLCEKPLALTLDDAQSAIDSARHARKVLAINLIMRYDPLCSIVNEITDRRLLGDPVHAILENYAKDEPLSPNHWFWDRAKSGGIFIEHGVHFFDLFDWWLGRGTIVAAQEITRPGTEIIEQVNCTAVYREAIPVNFYHGFTQPAALDRQEFRLLYERGDITLEEWIPTRMMINALLDKETLAVLRELMPGSRVTTVRTYAGADREMMGRHKHFTVDGHERIHYDAGIDKREIYRLSITRLMDDMIAAIRDPDHNRQVTEQDGYDSLAMAVAADRMAHKEMN